MNLQVKGVTKKFGDKIAVNNVTFELNEGVYGFLGSNGSGKTTLMRILANVSNQTSGQVYYNGENILDLDENYRDVLGYSPQHVGFYKGFTVEKFLLYLASLKGIKKEEAIIKISELLELVNLKDKRKVKMKKLSGGMKQKVGIAQALLNDPEVLIVDEPTAGLDPKERVRFRNLLAKIATNRIVLLSTHIVSDIEFIAKEVMILKDGKLIKKETPKKLLKGIENKVWTVLVAQNEIVELQSKFKVSNIANIGDEFELRIFNDVKPHIKAENATPNLEDLYLYYFDEGETY
ncbi:ATP-binding cassette domain-containing protein [Bacillaceae bacterium IKA-2]|nr:ATP-binding cassette domain-containing protein [Bacillaceae bacterium IKA-2]